MRELMIKTLRADKNLERLPLEAIENLVDRMITTNQFVMEEHGFAFYVRCSDELLAKIEANKEYLIYPDLAQRLLSGSGEHVHFIGIYSTKPNSNGYHSILRGLENVAKKEKPRSISWYDRFFQKFIIRRLKWEQPR